MDKSDFCAALRRILETDSDVLGVDRVNCWKLEREPPAIRRIAGYQRSLNQYEGGAVILQEKCRRYFQSLADDPLIIADDARADRRTRELAETYLVPHDVHSMLDVPIWVRGVLWGVVCHEHVGERRRWTDADRDFAVSIGHVVSMAVEARERARAERAVDVSELFVGALSHDLRNPLSVIRASAEHLLGRGESDAPTKTAKRIIRSADLMTRMIEQLLDFTSIRLGGGLPVRTQEMDLAALCRQVTADAAETHPTSAIDLRGVGDTAGAWDPDRLWQLVSNLVLNAIEHGTEHHAVGLSVDGADPDRVVIQISNHGAVPPALVPVIFEPFRKRETGTSRRGIGLGLFIAREIATAHGGSIDLETPPRETVFTVSLPRRRRRR